MYRYENKIKFSADAVDALVRGLFFSDGFHAGIGNDEGKWFRTAGKNEIIKASYRIEDDILHLEAGLLNLDDNSYYTNMMYVQKNSAWKDFIKQIEYFISTLETGDMLKVMKMAEVQRDKLHRIVLNAKKNSVKTDLSTFILKSKFIVLFGWIATTIAFNVLFNVNALINILWFGVWSLICYGVFNIVQKIRMRKLAGKILIK